MIIFKITCSVVHLVKEPSEFIEVACVRFKVAKLAALNPCIIEPKEPMFLSVSAAALP